MAERVSGIEPARRPITVEVARRCYRIASRLVPPCAQSGYCPCGLTDSAVEECNRALWCVGLQIRHDLRGNPRYGCKTVSAIRKLCSGFLSHHIQSESAIVALALLNILFKKHRCLVALQLFDVIAKLSAMLIPLQRISAVKELTIIVDPDEQPSGIRELVEYLKTVVVDEGLNLRFIEGVYRLDAQASLLLALLDQPEVKLTVLDLTGLTVNATEAETIVNALPKSTSLAELAVNSQVFASGPECKSSEHFAWYLVQNKAPIRRLHLDARDMNEECNSLELLSTLVRAICEMNFLLELTARWLCRAADIGLFGRVLTYKDNLHVLDVRCHPCCDRGAHRPNLRSLGESVMEPWYSGLPKNYHLRMVAVDLSLCTAEECGLFVEAVARAPVRSVTVCNVADEGCLQALYGAIRRHNVLRKVTVEDVHLGPADVKVLPCYPEASVVTLSSSHFPDVPALCGAIRGLAVCRHISSLRLRFDSYDESLYIATADVMAILAPTVREIKLYAEDFYEADDENRVACQNRLIKAVTSNRNLTRLKLHVAYLNATCCQFVADSVLNSWTLCELSLEALEVPSCAMFLRCLIPGVARNHSLLVASLPDCGDKLSVEMATLQDVTGRNVRFLALASRFVIHYRYGDPYGRDVLPLVAKHPNLVEMVARDGSVTETEAKSMVEGALQIVAPGPYA